jgi:uncharacterized protein (DUF983 family)
VIDERLSIENWWNDTDRWKEKYGKNLFQSLLVYHKSHMDCPEFGPEPFSGEADDWPAWLHLVSQTEWVLFLYVMMEVKIATETSCLFKQIEG